MAKVLIVEDELVWGVQVEMMLHSTGHEVVALVASKTEAIKVLSDKEVDILVLDINLESPGTGINLAQEVGGLPIVFMTQEQDIETYQKTQNIPHSQYLVKTFHAHSLDSAVRMLVEQFGNKQQYIRDGRSHFRVSVKDILWVKVLGNNSYIQTIEKQFVFKKSLCQLMKALPKQRFIQVYRSYVVAIDKITKIDTVENKIWVNGKTIPLSRTAKKELMERIKHIL